ncbi:MAG: DUF6516 family protein [Salinibacter sp.]
MHKALQAHDDVIASYEVSAYEVEGSNRRLRLLVTFHDGSTLHVRDYVFAGERRKYAFHWQDSHGELRIRWDNAPHWPDIDTHPHHKHVGDPNRVEPAEELELEDVLEEIARRLRSG